MTGAKEKRIELLDVLYRAYESWASQFSFACGKSCTACCTQSVTMTTLEGKRIITYLQEDQRIEWLNENLKNNSPTYIPVRTTNQFAADCLAEKESMVGDDSSWDFTPCLFLSGGSCTIYPARPFGCRSFSSLKVCNENSGAEMPPLLVTVNTMIMQMIEQLDCEQGFWGNMIDVLKLLNHDTDDRERLLPAQANPGFLVPPEERQAVSAFLARIQTDPS